MRVFTSAPVGAGIDAGINGVPAQKQRFTFRHPARPSSIRTSCSVTSPDPDEQIGTEPYNENTLASPRARLQLHRPSAAGRGLHWSTPKSTTSPPGRAPTSPLRRVHALSQVSQVLTLDYGQHVQSPSGLFSPAALTLRAAVTPIFVRYTGRRGVIPLDKFTGNSDWGRSSPAASAICSIGFQGIGDRPFLLGGDDRAGFSRASAA